MLGNNTCVYNYGLSRSFADRECEEWGAQQATTRLAAVLALWPQSFGANLANEFSMSSWSFPGTVPRTLLQVAGPGSG